MKTLKFPDKFFNIEDTLNCGQLFRFIKSEKGFFVYSKDKCCHCYSEDGYSFIVCEDDDFIYFKNYFDLSKNYESIYNSVQSSAYDIVKISSSVGKGIRILNQDCIEVLFSFIISQNNNIPRIKGIIERLCSFIGEKKYFDGKPYFAFPTVENMAKQPLEFYKNIGLGYRAEYIRKLAVNLSNGFNLNTLNDKNTEVLKKSLLKIYGVGPKVADCVALFGFHRSDSFPVDTWIEKVYREDFNGKLTDRKQITSFFLNEFKENAGYVQQYLFYYKRSLEKN